MPSIPITEFIADELNALPPRSETDSQTKKKNYAEALSRSLATKLANALRPYFDGIMPDEHGNKQESKARTSKGYKKLDINYSTSELGLGLGVSVKTLNFPDQASGRYTKNFTRVDNELRAEASDYHERQPYAVMVAIIFLPLDSCTDGRKRKLKSGETTTSMSSFAQAIHIFRHRADRRRPNDAAERFERLFLALYDAQQGPEFGRVRCFDVFSPPPKNGIPIAEL